MWSGVNVRHATLLSGRRELAVSDGRGWIGVLTIPGEDGAAKDLVARPVVQVSWGVDHSCTRGASFIFSPTSTAR